MGRRPVFVHNGYSSETDFSQTVFRNLTIVSRPDVACPSQTTTAAAEIRYNCSDIDLDYEHSSCLLLKGLFQCQNIAEHGRQRIWEMLQGLSQYRKATKSLRRLKRKRPGREFVALHVRRGDYTKKFNRDLLEPLPMRYYQDAMGHMPKNATFLVFSDDLGWCRDAFAEAINTGADVLFMKVDDPIEALITMALTTHNVIANSTFSWWSAFLNQNSGKMVCAPTPWFGSRVKEEISLYPEKWVQISAMHS